MNFFQSIIDPLVFILEEIYMLCYYFSHSAGIAIICLSFLVSLTLLPLFILIEKTKKKNDLLKAKMKPQLDEIKRCYKGQERYYYIKTLNRQYNFSTFKALIPLFTLLLQIPFFIAAYQLLNNYTFLSGKDFLIIKDLSKPDAILGITIHFLPIAMTLINLLTAFFYTRFGDKGERKQLYFIALGMLILLYNFSSGLLLYWTFNNLFSFFRLFITKPKVFFNLKSIKKFLDFIKRKKHIDILFVNPSISLLFAFGSLYLFIAAKLYYTGNKPPLLILSLLLIYLTEIFGFLHIQRKKYLFKKKKSYFLLALIVFLFGLQHYFLFSLPLTFPSISDISKSITTGLTLISIICILYIFTKKSKNQHKQLILFFLPSLYLISLIYICGPLTAYSSFAIAFQFSPFELFLNNIPWFFLSISIILITYLILPSKLRFILNLTIIVLSISAFIYTYIVPIQLGDFIEGQYVNEAILEAETSYYLLEYVFLVTLILLVTKLDLNKHRRKLIYIYTFMLLIMYLQTSIKLKEIEYSNNSNLENDNLTTISFSKTEQNIVYFVADMFLGAYMHDILKDYPKLYEELEGFVYYPNTISISPVTITSMGPMLLGKEYAIDIEEFNHSTMETLSSKMVSQSELFFDQIKAKNFHITANKIPYTSAKPKSVDTFLPIWNENWGEFNAQLNISKPNPKVQMSFLVGNSLFYAMPLFLKSWIYNNGNWFYDSNSRSFNAGVSKYCNFIRLLPHISNTTSNEKNFIFYHSMSTHYPWNKVDNKNKFIKNVSSYENQKWFLLEFVRWLDWMRTNEVYDNTKIILASDHGLYIDNAESAIFADSLFWDKSGQNKLPSRIFWRLNPLLLVKDFHETNKLKYNNQLMSNSDIPSILFNTNYSDSVVNSDSRILNTYVTYTGYNEPKYHFQIKTNIYNSKNWTLVK